MPTASPNYVHAPAANTAATITLAAAGEGLAHFLPSIKWSYNATPSSGNLKVEDGSGVVVFNEDITTDGAGFFEVNIQGSANTALIITLSAGGSGVSGKLSLEAPHVVRVSDYVSHAAYVVPTRPEPSYPLPTMPARWTEVK